MAWKKADGNGGHYIFLSTVLGMYTHLYVVFIPVAQYISVLFLPRRDISWKHLVTSGAAIAVFIRSDDSIRPDNEHRPDSLDRNAANPGYC